MQTRVKTQSEIQKMRESGRMLATVLNVLIAAVQPGMFTKELSVIAAAELNSLGGKPTFLGYQGFSDVLCVSINDEVVHGIPNSSRLIMEGDILSLDFGVTYEGMITDAARTIIVGKPKQKNHKELVERTHQSLEAGIAVVRNKVRTGDIGEAVQTVLDKYRYGIVRDLVGHGVGHYLHEDPNIPNYGRSNTGPWLSTGMTIAIEPMATLGTDRVNIAADGWTIRTADQSMSAHFENTILIGDDSAEVLTTI